MIKFTSILIDLVFFDNSGARSPCKLATMTPYTRRLTTCRDAGFLSTTTITLFPNLPLSKGAIWLLLRSHRIFMIPRRTLYHLKQTHHQQAFAELKASSISCRHFHPTMAATDPRASLKPAARVAGKKLDVWYVLILNMLSVFPFILPYEKVVEHELRKWESQQNLD